MDTPTPNTASMSAEARLSLIETKLDFLVEEARKAKRSRQIVLWLTIAFFVLPLVGILAMIPTLTGQINAITNIQ